MLSQMPVVPRAHDRLFGRLCGALVSILEHWSVEELTEKGVPVQRQLRQRTEALALEIDIEVRSGLV